MQISGTGSFYVLSGFLMTLILNQNYGFDGSGFMRFATNRILRLFPVYYVVIGLTALHITFIGPLNQINGAITVPSTVAEQFANLSIVSLTGFDFSQQAGQRLVPTAWSLSIELFCYALLAVYFAKSRARLLFMLIVGVGLAAVQILSTLDQPDYGFQNHYGVMQAGIVPFAIGGLAYFFRKSHLFVYSSTRLWIFSLLFFANFLVGYWSDFHKYVSGLYIIVALNLVLVPMLFSQETKNRWQKLLGGLSYPIFISHWFIGTLVVVYLPIVASKSLMHLFVATIATVMFSLLLYYGLDQPLQRVRIFIKNRNSVLARRA